MIDGLEKRLRDLGTNPRILHEEQLFLNSAADVIERSRHMVLIQAEDEGLWFEAKTAPEAYLQQELRRLHAAIEI